MWLNWLSGIDNIPGQSVAVSITDPLRLAHVLVLLDGMASDILLIPDDLGVSQSSAYLAELNTSVIFTDNNEDVKCLSGGNIQVTDIRSWFFIDENCTSNATEVTFVEDPQIDTRWVIPTSGTTGQPKLISHTIASLTRSIKQDLQKGSRYCWGMLYQVTRFAGLQVFLQSFLSGSKLVFTERESTPEKMVSQLVCGECNALSATATMYRKLMLGSDISQLSLKQITLGGEIADQQVLNALSALHPKARIVHIYASTEAGVGFAVTDKLAGFPKEYTESTIFGVDIKVSDDNYLLLRNKKMHQKQIGNAHGMFDASGFVNTGDLVSFEDGRYQFIGRANGAINVGGNKVQPEEIERVILAIPEVKLVSVSSKKSPITGELVVATVVPIKDNVDTKEFKGIVLKYCREKLADFKVPALLKVASDIEVNHSGKIKR